MNPQTNSTSSANVRKPWVSLFIATAGGVGYLPKAPGTWGSLVGVVLFRVFIDAPALDVNVGSASHTLLVISVFLFGVAFAFFGVFPANQVARWSGHKDPQYVVIDEVSGQFVTYLFAFAPANWKYLLLGFILFRVFDIWKPFPVRQAESLPGGWGIMADDWAAAVYAAIGIWIARTMGL